jgi:hypothetical protein
MLSLRNILILTILVSIPPPSTAQDISQARGCTITCCINCKENYNCKICYNLNKDNKDGCPCVEDLSPRQRAGLKIAAKETVEEEEDNRAETFLSFDEALDKVSPLKSRFEKFSEDSTIYKKGSEIPLCMPSWCYNSSCTEATCPVCYKKFRRDPQSYPCVNTGKILLFCTDSLS